jgi:uncharacterized protein (TIRG00374 family)
MKHVAMVAKFAVTAGVFWYVLRVFPLTELMDKLEATRFEFLAAGTAVLALQPLLSVFRWRIVLRRLGSDLTFSTVLQVSYIGLFFNQVLPASVGGEVIRVWMITGRGSPFGQSATSVVIDHGAMLLTLIVIAMAAGCLLPARVELPGPVTVILALLLAAALVGLCFATIAERWWPERSGGRFTALAHLFAQHFRRVFLHPITLAKLIGIALLCLLNSVAALVIYAAAFKEPFDVVSFAMLTPLVLLISALPISIGGWGTREAASVALFGLAGMAASTALLTSSVFGFASILATLPGAVLYHIGKTSKRAEQLSLATPPVPKTTDAV